MPAGTFNLSLVDAPVLGVWAEVMESNLVYIKDLTKKYDDLEIHITSPQASGAYGVHITPPLTNKLTATTELLRQMGVDPKRTLAIGDGDNDMPLFQVGGTCVAMGNASSTLKLLADYTTESIERDGFMYAINKYILNSQASKEV